MPRFVILLHKPGTASAHLKHFDFMMETQEGTELSTWRWDRLPNASIEFQGLQLAPHRLEYLNYEGEISGERGHVSQQVTGTYLEAISCRDSEWEIQLESEELTGILRGLHIKDDQWLFDFRQA